MAVTVPRRIKPHVYHTTAYLSISDTGTLIQDSVIYIFKNIQVPFRADLADSHRIDFILSNLGTQPLELTCSTACIVQLIDEERKACILRS